MKTIKSYSRLSFVTCDGFLHVWLFESSHEPRGMYGRATPLNWDGQVRPDDYWSSDLGCLLLLIPVLLTLLCC